MKVRIEKLISNKRNIIILYILFALAAGIQTLSSGPKTFEAGGKVYTHYNNYIIFERSFHHLKYNQDLYSSYPDEYWDLYKYTPTFSAFFGLFAIFPAWIGLNLWNLVNALILLLAIYYLPRLEKIEKGLILIIILIELMTSMQSQQSNALIAGLLVLSFGLLEKKHYLFAALCIVFTAYIKIFGIVGLALFLFYPKKWKLALYTILWTIVLFVVPLAFVNFSQYIRLFHSYWTMLNADYTVSYGYSVMGWFYTWFGLGINKNIIILAGAVVFLIPFLRLSQYMNYTFRYLALTSILIWIVIFNYKAESPTFIIAITGVAMWFFSGEKSIPAIILFTLAFIFTSLSPTDIFPRFLRETYVNPYALKAVPCILIWMKIIYDMVVLKKDNFADMVNNQQIV